MGYRLSKIYTRTGDQGQTGLGDGARISKDAVRIEAFGTVDELNSVLGIVLSKPVPDTARAVLTEIQHRLFDLGGEEPSKWTLTIQDGAASVRLGDVATVKWGHKEREEITRVNGVESVEIAVFKEGDANIVEMARAVSGHPIPAVDGPRRPGDPSRLVAANGEASRRLGWTPARSAASPAARLPPLAASATAARPTSSSVTYWLNRSPDSSRAFSAVSNSSHSGQKRALSRRLRK